MGKKLQRLFRDRRLTADEAASDRDVRSKVQAEYPPSYGTTARQPSPLGELLRQAIRESGKSVDTLSHESGVPAVLITSFLSGERDIHLTTADKLAHSLGLEMTAE
jgi:hypothetical protein